LLVPPTLSVPTAFEQRQCPGLAPVHGYLRKGQAIDCSVFTPLTALLPETCVARTMLRCEVCVEP
jgi:hypothetical protein